MSKARHARPRRRSRRIVRTLSIAGLGAGITAVGASAANAADYTVKHGDTLSEIAQAHGTNWHRLAELNNLNNPDLILVGQQLELNGGHKVTARDSERRSTWKSERKVRKTERSSERKRERSTERKSTRTEERQTRKRDRGTRTESNRGSSRANLSGAWAKVAHCESSGNPRAVSPAGYYGLFQFDHQTWRSVGGSGNPASASAGEQLMRAKKLYSQRGASPWPNCGRYLR
ncbi:LysM domain-containing protein [Kribbella amoyensis]|uniref:LysM domain-containing protein n=1 Tax=Kribbella amoyensis TaxID=996641 RepID=A0A561BM50_9ACTN|nr:transglycosylase family protein [Kribbella amoyensis]TWD79908.1 LysM domain-containing protein [Kribbella amoyensis]